LRCRSQLPAMEDKELMFVVLAAIAVLMFLTGFVLVIA
jgi:hypothetical protein